MNYSNLERYFGIISIKSEKRHADTSRCHIQTDFGSFFSDTSFLLRFLRAKKFNLQETGELFENYLFYNTAYPQWFKNISTGDENVAEIIDRGYIVPLPKKDKAGRQIIFYRTKRLDPDRFTSADMTKAQELVCRRLLLDDEVQIGGAIFLSDDADLVQEHITSEFFFRSGVLIRF